MGEQDHSSGLMSTKKNIESQLVEMEGRLADAEGRAMKEGKNALSKLELTIRELEAELGSTQTQTLESVTAFQRSDRKVKELKFAQDEDKKNQTPMFDHAK